LFLIEFPKPAPQPHSGFS